MHPPTLNTLLGEGWTYCPRCELDSMVIDGSVAGWHCPWCGLTTAVIQPPPMPEMMAWNEVLTNEELTRERAHLQARATAWMVAHKDDKPVKLPQRLRWFNRLVRPLSWALGCKVVALLDKKDKEATSEQGK